jgi:hypothetical protein
VTLDLRPRGSRHRSRAAASEPIEWFGGVCTIRGALLQKQRLDSTAPATLLPARSDHDVLFVDVWCHWCPDQPWRRAKRS